MGAEASGTGEAASNRGQGKNLSHRPLLTYLLLALLPVCVGLLLTALLGTPVPHAHDEFSYLFAAKTFAMGRLTNPTHPLWRHFETFQILQQPTNASRYPVGQGLFLALGLILAGKAIVGVWLSGALLDIALFWMLRAFVPFRWAIAGTVLSVLSLMSLDWLMNYWGGFIAMYGGALVVGAVARLSGRPVRAIDGFWAGMGLIVLANSRPYEGAILVLLCCMFWGKPCYLNLRADRRAARSAVLALLLPVIVGASWLLVYHRAVTGSPFLMPHRVYTAQYESNPIFIWESEVHWRTIECKPMRDLDRELTRDCVAAQRSFSTKCLWMLGHALTLLRFVLLSPLLMIGILVSITAWIIGKPQPPWERRSAGMMLVFLLITSGSAYAKEHYAAPAVPLMVLLGVQGLRRLAALRLLGAFRLGRRLPNVVIPVVSLLSLLLFVRLHHRVNPADRWALERQNLLKALERSPDKSLVIVRYDSDHDLLKEWVFNDPDIDQAKVVWARDLGGRRNDDLLTYFKHRRIWRLDADAEPTHLTPYKAGLYR